MLNEQSFNRQKVDKHDSLARAIHNKLSGIQNEHLKHGMNTVSDRMQVIDKISGITFINDSKSTTVNATWFALENIAAGIVLIMGGVDRNNDYSHLQQLVHDKVTAIVCLGSDTTKISTAFDVEIIVSTNSMSEAVRMAYRLVEKGGTVLLSPACASFDLFKNYEDRGEQFNAAVKELSPK